MSKRQSVGQTNTLLNYFQSPKIKKQENQNGRDLDKSTSNPKSENLNSSLVENGKEILFIFT